jgi:CRP-like cAMP-binding protein
MTAPRQLSEFVQALAPDQRRAFDRQMRVVSVNKGQAIITHGSAADEVYFIIEGELEVRLFSQSGREVLLRIAGPGDVLGEIAAIDGGTRSATIVARNRCRLAQLSAADFRRMLEHSPKASQWVLGRHAAIIRGLTDRVYELITFSVNGRVCAELLRLADEAGAENNRSRITRMPTHREFASKVGTTREAVTRQFSELVRRKLISKKRGRELTVLDVEGLTALLQSLVAREAKTSRKR